MLPCVSSVIDHKWIQKAVRTKCGSKAAGECVADVPTAFWCPLWSIGEIKHSVYDKREFVPRDQVYHLLVITVHYNYTKIGKYTSILSIRIVFKLFLSVHFSFRKFINFNLTLPVCRKRTATWNVFLLWRSTETPGVRFLFANFFFAFFLLLAFRIYLQPR